MVNEWKIRNKRESCSKFLLAGINKFLSFLNNYNLAKQNILQITFSQIIIYLIY